MDWHGMSHTLWCSAGSNINMFMTKLNGCVNYALPTLITD